jgi:hypothetical protein
MRSSVWTADELVGKKELAVVVKPHTQSSDLRADRPVPRRQDLIEKHIQEARAAAPGQSKKRKARKGDFDSDDSETSVSEP